MKIALVGNQNSGKSTLFNTLTGSNQKVGNWPGVTIEKKTGIIRNTKFELIDLPGIYSINSYTEDEKVTSNFIFNDEVDVFINIIDCNSINRGLYLTTQLIDLNKKIIIVLNMYDIAEKKGFFIDEDKLSQSLGNIKIIKISAITGEGTDKLVDELNRIDKQKKARNFNINIVNKADFFTEEYIENKYKYIDNILSQCVKNNKMNIDTLTDKLDKVLLNRFLAVPIFVLIMLLIYYISIDVVGNNTIDIINKLFEFLSQRLEFWLNANNVKQELISLLINGVIKGVNAVTSFLPQLAFLFISISFFEKIGYMSRISLIFDKFFKTLGMSGQSVISFIIGTGCSVPAIMATKTIKNEREKKNTIILTPFMPCSAKLPIISLFSTYFFKERTGIIAFSFYILAIVIIILSGILFKQINNKIDKQISKKTKLNTYFSELPEFRRPKLKQLFKDSFDRVLDFVKRAGSVILISSVVIWILLSYSLEINIREEKSHIIELTYGVNTNESILANIGRIFSWIFIPMVGENSWEIAVSSIQGLIAKEQVISSMAIISGLENENVSNSIFVQGQGSPFEFFNKASAYAYVCFNLFSAPCFGAIGAMKKALGGIKNIFLAIGYQLGVAYIISCLIYNIGNIFLNNV